MNAPSYENLPLPCHQLWRNYGDIVAQTRSQYGEMEAMMVHLRSMKFAFLASGALVLAACSAAEEQDSTVQSPSANGPMAEGMDVRGASPQQTEPVADNEAAAPGDASSVSIPRMAYVFDYAFQLPGAEIAPLQLRHADMCEAMGPSQCMIVGMTASGGEDEDATGRLELAVASARARGFVTELSALAEGFHGKQVAANIIGEDLSKSLVDTEARLRSRIELRDRLLEVLRTRTGDVAELVAAERNVAAINEEIDQTRSWLGEMRGRVSFSRVVLSYESTTATGSDFLEPVAEAFGSLGWILGRLAALLIVLSGIVAPFLLAALGLRWWQRRRLIEST